MAGRQVTHRENAQRLTAVRHATAQDPLRRLAARYDALRAAYRDAQRVAAARGDTALTERVDRAVEDAATCLADAAARVLALREQPSPRRGHAS